jgi:hypothetical protein
MSTFEQEFNISKLRRNGIINLMKPHPKVIKMCDEFLLFMIFRHYISSYLLPTETSYRTDNEATVSLIKSHKHNCKYNTILL